MKRIPLSLERSGDRGAEQAQRQVHPAVARFNTSLAGRGAFVGPYTFTAGGSQRILHTLDMPTGGTPKGWIAADVSGGYGSFQRTEWDSTSMTIQSANACTASFWVFA